MSENAAEKKEWEQLEILVAKIQEELAPDATVTHNVRIKGTISGELRQVDVLVQKHVGQYDIQIIIDCKDYKRPVDVKGVDEFIGLMKDVGANKGALVCPKGFTKAAKKSAKAYGVDLYSPVDTDPHKWQVKPTLPMICDFRSAAIAFGVSVTAPMPFRMPNDFFREMRIFNAEGVLLGTPFEVGIARWNNGELPADPGEHENVPIFTEPNITADNGYGTQIPVTIYASLLVKQRIFFGYLPVSKMRGLRDEQSGMVVTNAFTTGAIRPHDIESNWRKLAVNEDPPVPPVIRVVGLDCWKVEKA